MQVPKVTEEQANGLIDDLAEALEQMVDQTCIDMAVFWLAATRTAREALPCMVPAMDFEPSPQLRNMSKSSASKYRALACWRHAVLWRHAREGAELDDLGRACVDAIYFTPCANRTPYAWSRSAKDCPALPAGCRPGWVKERAADVAGELLQRLRAECRRRAAGNAFEELEGGLLKLGTGKSLDDVLKLEGEKG